MKFDKKILSRYFVMGTQDVQSEADFFSILKQALESGVTVFQYREKGKHALSSSEKERVAFQVRELTKQYGVPLIIDDDIPLAKLVNADGIHFGQEDGNPTENIKLADNLFVGVSVSNIAEYEKIANLSGIDYIGIGPIFKTKSKSDAKPEIGIKGLTMLNNISYFPTVAIGGITIENIVEVLSTETNGVAVISMISQSDNIKRTLAYWQELECKL